MVNKVLTQKTLSTNEKQTRTMIYAGPCERAVTTENKNVLHIRFMY